MNVIDRVETLKYLKDKSNSKERLVVPRYNDGEYLLMHGKRNVASQTSSEIISTLLKRSIRVKGQFVCINYLKPHNIEKKDIWYQSHNYLSKEGGHELYGCGNWLVHDFCNDNVLLPKIFSGRCLLVAGLSEASNFFREIQPELKFYKHHLEIQFLHMILLVSM